MGGMCAGRVQLFRLVAESSIRSGSVIVEFTGDQTFRSNCLTTGTMRALFLFSFFCGHDPKQSFRVRLSHKAHIRGTLSV